jgi:hypothetical protein
LGGLCQAVPVNAAVDKLRLGSFAALRLVRTYCQIEQSPFLDLISTHR